MIQFMMMMMIMVITIVMRREIETKWFENKKSTDGFLRKGVVEEQLRVFLVRVT